MRSLLPCLDVVVEIPLHLDFGDGSEKPSSQAKREPQPEGNPAIAQGREEEILYPILRHSGYHCDLVFRTLVHKISYSKKPLRILQSNDSSSLL